MVDRRVIVAGEALIDLIQRPDGSLGAVPGGGPFNVARTIARLGQPCSFLGTISTDAFGRRLREVLAEDHVDMAQTRFTDAPTTLAIAALDTSGVATYQFYLASTAAADLQLTDVDPPLFGTAGALHVGTLGLVMEPIGTTIASLVARLPADTSLMVDPNCRAGAILDRPSYIRRLQAIVARADIVKVSSDDLAYLFPHLGVPDAAQELLGWGARLVLATAGAGSVLIVGVGGLRLEEQVPLVEVVDTVGAGDAFGGAFLAWFARRGFRRADLENRVSLREGTREAIAAAAITCQRIGADPPTRAELSRFVGSPA